MTTISNKPTYQALLDTLQVMSANKARNLATAREWMAFHGVQLTDELPHAMTYGDKFDWERCQAAFSAHIKQKHAAAKQTIWNKHASLRVIREIGRDLAAGRLVSKVQEKDKIVNHILDRVRRGEFMHMQIPECIRQFILGKRTSFTSKVRDQLIAFEDAAGLSPGTLTQFERKPAKFDSEIVLRKPQCKKKTADFTPLPLHFQSIVESYREYKVAPVPKGGLNRAQKWTINSKGEYPTAILFEKILTAQYNFQIRTPRPLGDDGYRFHGMGRDPKTIQFVDLFRASTLIDFLDWEIERQNGEVSHGVLQTHTAHFFSMFAIGTGWIRQQPKLFVPMLRVSQHRDFDECDFSNPATAVADFDAWCDQQVKELKRYTKAAKGSSNSHFKSRDPDKRLAPILEAADPLGECIGLIEKFKERSTERYLSDKERLNLEIRCFLVAALLAVPLRILTLCSLKLGEHLVKNPQGRWEYRIPRALFKNRRYLREDFNVPLPDWAQPHFSRFVDFVRPKMEGTKHGSPYLIPLPRPAKGADPLKQVDAQRISLIFRQGIAQVWGVDVGPHAFRHIQATAYLQDNPGGVNVAAALLNDKPETVLRHYCHVKVRDTYKVASDWQSEKFKNIAA